MHQHRLKRNLGIEDKDDIRQFLDPHNWISYFSSYTKQDLEMMGLKVSFGKLSSYYAKGTIY
jgi:hypothetical protein